MLNSCADVKTFKDNPGQIRSPSFGAGLWLNHRILWHQTEITLLLILLPWGMYQIVLFKVDWMIIKPMTLQSLEKLSHELDFLWSCLCLSDPSRFRLFIISSQWAAKRDLRSRVNLNLKSSPSHHIPLQEEEMRGALWQDRDHSACAGWFKKKKTAKRVKIFMFLDLESWILNSFSRRGRKTTR